MQAVSRTVALSVGLVGGVLAFFFSAIYSLFHWLGRVSGITADHGHFLIGLGLSLVAIVGAFLVLIMPEASAVVLVLATIGLFFIIGWWAFIPAIFLLIAAWLAFMSWRARRRTAPSQAPA